MAYSYRTTKIAGLVIGALAMLTGAARAEPPLSANDTARLLAGLPPSGGSSATSEDAIWKSHAHYFDDAWGGLEKRQLSKVRAWSSKYLPNQANTLFYMFSGPDFLYADAFFPTPTTYIMAGLEPPGEVPDLRKLSKGELSGALSELRSSLNSVLNYSFFRTKEMSYELRSGKLVGTVPIILTFMARSGKTIYSVDYVNVQSDGSLHEASENLPNPSAKGAKITFSDNTGLKKTLYYFSTDVSNGGLKKNGGFFTYLDKFGTGDSFVKSASYLMHSDNFSTVREFLMTHSDALLQDNSGIPVRFLAKGWRLNPFGAYVGPIPIFAYSTQSVYYKMFAKGKTGPLGFGIGYRYRPMESNLMLAVKDGSATAAELIPPVATPAATAAKPATTGSTPARVEAKTSDAAPKPRVVRRRYTNQKTVSNPESKMFGYLP